MSANQSLPPQNILQVHWSCYMCWGKEEGVIQTKIRKCQTAPLLLKKGWIKLSECMKGYLGPVYFLTT